jgi:hypothetical protein
MARRRQSRPQRQSEHEVIAQANPTPEQRGKSRFVVALTINPEGATEIIQAGKTMIADHKVCRKQPPWLNLRGGLNDDTLKVLAWYDDRLSLARKGMTMDSIGKLLRPMGGGTQAPVEAAMQARIDVDHARAHIRDGLCLRVFDEVMEHERTFTDLGGGNNEHEAAMIKAFKLAANWLLLGIGGRVLA